MPKFARPNSYTGKQSNQQWTGDARSATLGEALAGESAQVYISPKTLAAAAGVVVPTATTLVAGKSFLATNAQAIAGILTDDHVINPASLFAALGTPPAIASVAGVPAKLGNSTGTLGFFGATGATKVTQGALTNSVTSGGTTGTIANYTDLTVYANDAAAIRNDIYQLALALTNTIAALRSYGLLV